MQHVVFGLVILSEVCSPFTEVYLLLVSPPVDEITEA